MAQVLTDLETLRDLVIRGTDAILNLTAGADFWRNTKVVFRFADAVAASGCAQSRALRDMAELNEAEHSGSGDYVSKVCDLRDYAAHGSILVAAKYLRTSSSGSRSGCGAYGGFCNYGRLWLDELWFLSGSEYRLHHQGF